VTDTPPSPPTFPPPPISERVKSFIGDLARPFAIYVTSGSAGIATVIVATKVQNGNDGAIALGAVGVLVGGIYGFRAWESREKGKQEASVEIAKATQTGA